MSSIEKFTALSSKIWELLGSLEAATGVPFDEVKFSLRTRFAVTTYLADGRTANAVDAMDTIAARLGTTARAQKPFESELTPSGKVVVLTVTADTEDTYLNIRAQLDADEYAAVIEKRKTAEVPA